MTLTRVVDRPRSNAGQLASTSEALGWVQDVVAEQPDGLCRDWPGSVNPKGYGQMGYEGRTRQVGHVVLELSGRPRPNPSAHQLHSCDRPSCAAPWHLTWGTNAENRAEMVDRGRASKGENRPMSKLTDALVREIRTSSETLAALAARFGVGVPTVQKAAAGETWKHVDAPVRRRRRVDESGAVGVVIEDGSVREPAMVGGGSS